MVTHAGTGLARVVIIAPSRRFAVALPEHVPVATLLPGVVRQAGEQAEPELPDSPMWALGGWVLRRADGALLDPTRTLSALELRHGETLHLVPRSADWPEPEYDDVVEAIAAGARSHGTPWSALATRRAGLVGAAVALLVALGLIVRAESLPVGAVVAVVMGVVLLAVGTVLARAAGDSVAGAVFGAIGVPYLFVGGLLTLTDAGDRLGDLGAPHLLVAGTAALVGAAIGQIGISDGEGVFIAGIVAGAAAAAGAALGLTSLDGTQSAAVVLTVLVLIHPALPLISVRAGKVPIPTIPQTVEDLLRDEAPPPADSVFAAARRGHVILTGLIQGVSLASAVCLALTARAGGVAAPLLSAIAVAALLLRTRAWRTVGMRVPMLVAGGFGAALLLANVADRMSDLYLLGVIIPGLLIAAGLVAAAALVFSRRGGSPYPGRIADVLDVVLVLAIGPVLLAVLDLYGAMLDFKL